MISPVSDGGEGPPLAGFGAVDDASPQAAHARTSTTIAALCTSDRNEGITDAQDRVLSMKKA
jgi:hypothetical protein